MGCIYIKNLEKLYDKNKNTLSLEIRNYLWCQIFAYKNKNVANSIFIIKQFPIGRVL